ncbi:uncharacterized protein LOC123563601 isoform X2 [Mercenaria mercenaria]|uniref:uncharacterized protein LOC123563601 isoform X2 n=1 Tax=Mercenaria mercenaria TaxID=6596 RepID=UPI00234EA975|nr:uncharacterized protein LOC123563601 isoform X2 [Mercenaria mercenaria]
MDYFSNWNDCKTRKTVPHGRVHQSSHCSRDLLTTCPYVCFDGYEKPLFINEVFCSRLSGRWETWTGEQPCTATKHTTKIHFHAEFPTMPGAIPPSTRRRIKPTTFKPDLLFNFNVQNVYPRVTTSDPTPRDPGADTLGSAAIFGIIMAVIIGSAFLLVCCWTCLIKCVTARRQAKTRTRAIRNLVILHNAYSPPSQRHSQTIGQTTPQSTELGASSTSSSNTINNPVRGNTPTTGNGNSNGDQPLGRENSNEEGGLIFLYIRRFIPIFRHPVPSAPPEPPPYDAEGAAPPAYEEEGTPNISTQQTQSEPPPPYSVF